MRRLILLFTVLAASTPAAGQRPLDDPYSPEPFYSTFSIIARDPATGELGVGVQSRAFRAGAAVPWAKAGVGAIATQAAANQTYGPKAIELLEKGMSPEEVIKKITDDDSGRERRQVAVIDAMGRTAAYTGKGILGGVNYAGHVAGKDYSVQGNTLAGESVVKAMARAFETSKGELAERLLAALDAGQSEGGDARGMQAGGILVVKPITDPNTTTDRWVDIRVDDAPNPFLELRRLLNISLSSRHTQAASRLADENKLADAVEAQKRAILMNPGSDQLVFNLAVLYARAGDTANAIDALAQAINRSVRWKTSASGNAAFARIKDFPEFKRLVAP